MPLSVDGEHVASLEAGRCVVFLLAGGMHRVAAGRENPSVITNDYFRRVLDVEVRAGQSLVLEYRVDDEVLDEFSLDSLVRRDSWVERGFRLHQRTAAFDCVMREPARVVGRRNSPGDAR